MCLSACAQFFGPAAFEGPRPAPRGTPPETAEPALDPARVARFAEIETRLLNQGLLRTDAGPAVTDPERLTQSFLRVAMFNENTVVDGSIIAQEKASPLRRWEGPVRVKLMAGPGVPKTIESEDQETVIALTERLTELSKHPIRITTQTANFGIFLVSDADRQAIGPSLRTFVPGITDPFVAQITELPDAFYCIVVAFSDQSAPAVYVRAIAIVRAELPSLLRRSCYHEELTQGLGLANDSPDARPSLFNDDKEYAFLTGQDELMITMLYDPRLSPGMTIEEARPIADMIAKELLDGSETTEVAEPAEPQES
ncbi:MAG: DUF2927 domain-containing protein [Pseudomonadota bacterium]